MVLQNRKSFKFLISMWEPHSDIEIAEIILNLTIIISHPKPKFTCWLALENFRSCINFGLRNCLIVLRVIYTSHVRGARRAQQKDRLLGFLRREGSLEGRRQ